jgi:hypothetical protein
MLLEVNNLILFEDQAIDAPRVDFMLGRHADRAHEPEFRLAALPGFTLSFIEIAALARMNCFQHRGRIPGYSKPAKS